MGNPTSDIRDTKKHQTAITNEKAHLSSLTINGGYYAKV